ncbi:hypothetical protein HN832_01060 [archaeon]|jgi:hypothetical protein|nr:hypothetical protein [archaeon]MBT4373801.1 hypothetical protein [archaeon]MBT4532267.1 hypothetical protein [archaeon]MBT7001092.1 hypothetical protein [archaeon]MBT7281981.1 hypothetical protein [archaeon]
MARKNKKTKKKGGIVGEIELGRLPPALGNLACSVFKDSKHAGNSRKIYHNQQGHFFGEGPFVEFVGKGNKGRLVLDFGSGEVYATLDHHNSYRLVV